MSREGLTPKQSAFVDEYLKDLNATKAAGRAGYSDPNIGRQLITKPNVADAIAVRMSEREKRTEITQDYVLTTIRNTIERCSQAEPVTDSEGNPTGEYRFDASAVLKGCELLGKHMAMWTDKQTLQNGDGSAISINVTFAKPRSESDDSSPAG